MHESGSYIRTFIDKVRMFLEEPDIDSKYSDSLLLRYYAQPAYQDVVSRLSNTVGCPVVLQYRLVFDGSLRRYVLPPCVQQVLNLRILDEDEEDQEMFELVPRSRWHRDGPGWELEGNAGNLALVMQHLPPDGMVARIYYTTNGDFQAHLGSGTLARVGGTARVALAATPTLGLLDRRENALAGQCLRILSSSPLPICTRQITRSYLAGSTWYAEVDDDFPTEIADGSITYEVVPSGDSMFWEAVSCWAAMKLGVGRKITENHREDLRLQYRMSIKTIGDNLTNANGRKPQFIEKNTQDNPDALGPFNWIMLS